MKKALALAMALFLLCPLWGCRGDQPSDASAPESTPAAYAYMLHVTINPQLTLFMDAQDRVVDVRADNADAKADFADAELVGKPLTEALDVIVDTAAEKGRLKDGGKVEMVVDTANAPETDAKAVLDAAEQTVRARLTEKKLTAEVVASVAAQADGLPKSTTDAAPVPSATTPPASTAETTASTTKMSPATAASTTKVPPATTASTTKKPAATTAKAVTADDLYGSYVYRTVKGDTGYRYTVTLDRKDSRFVYSLNFGGPVEDAVEAGMYKSVEEALADKNAVWNLIDGKYYGEQAGDAVIGTITALTLDAVSVKIDDTEETVQFHYDAAKGTLTIKSASLQNMESAKGLVLTREK